MQRGTKIVATLGPASSSPEVLEQMIRAGVDVMRLNFSHGTAQDHIARAELVREVAKRAGKEVAIMADLQGPKIRVGKFEGGKTMLENGQKFVLDGATTELGTNERVGLDYKELPRDVKAGDTLLLNDGLLKLTVDAVRGDEVHTTVVLVYLCILQFMVLKMDLEKDTTHYHSPFTCQYKMVKTDTGT